MRPPGIRPAQSRTEAKSALDRRSAGVAGFAHRRCFHTSIRPRVAAAATSTARASRERAGESAGATDVALFPWSIPRGMLDGGWFAVTISSPVIPFLLCTRVDDGDDSGHAIT